MEKCHTIVEKYGYTGSACIPMALDDAIELGKITRGDLVVMISSGLGYNAAAAVRMTVFLHGTGRVANPATVNEATP